jgi:hypothetical protein
MPMCTAGVDACRDCLVARMERGRSPAQSGTPVGWSRIAGLKSGPPSGPRTDRFHGIGRLVRPPGR